MRQRGGFGRIWAIVGEGEAGLVARVGEGRAGGCCSGGR